jgi:nitrogen fixation protein NifX
MTLRVAVASRDGRNVHLHFGHADTFHVYDVSADAIALVEVRGNAPSCEPGGGKEAAHLATLDLLGDCQALVVAAVGPHALRHIEARGLACFVSEDSITSALAELATLEAGGDASNVQ